LSEITYRPKNVQLTISAVFNLSDELTVVDAFSPSKLIPQVHCLLYFNLNPLIYQLVSVKCDLVLTSADE